MYNSECFQMIVALLIFGAFTLDICEAQVTLIFARVSACLYGFLLHSMQVCLPTHTIFMQLLPAKGSESAETFFILDAVITVLFAIELMVNIFAHSNDGFHPFYSKGSNWCVCVCVCVCVCMRMQMSLCVHVLSCVYILRVSSPHALRSHVFSRSRFDASIVIISIANVITTALGSKLPNAKLLRLLRLGRAIRLFSALKDLNRLITAISFAVVPVCNAFIMLFIIGLYCLPDLCRVKMPLGVQNLTHTNAFDRQAIDTAVSFPVAPLTC